MMELILYKQPKQPWLYSVITRPQTGKNPQVSNWKESNEKLPQHIFQLVENIPNPKLRNKLVGEVQIKYFIISPFGMIVLSLLSRALPS